MTYWVAIILSCYTQYTDDCNVLVRPVISISSIECQSNVEKAMRELEELGYTVNGSCVAVKILGEPA